MPEGHTIHRLASDHAAAFAGQTLNVTSPQGRFLAGAQRIDGRVLTDVSACGKHLLYDFEGRTLHVHLGLYGKFRMHPTPPPEPRGQVRVRAIGASKSFDLNGPAICEILTKSGVRALLNRLGPDPLRADSDPDPALQRIGRSRVAIGSLLLDQSVIAGIGNIYRAEILYLLGIHPETPGRDIAAEQLSALWDLSVDLLKVGKRFNRIITTDPRQVGKTRSRMNRRESLHIYKKSFCPRCHEQIQSWKLAARTIYACPSCQPKQD